MINFDKGKINIAINEVFAIYFYKFAKLEKQKFV